MQNWTKINNNNCWKIRGETIRCRLLPVLKDFKISSCFIAVFCCCLCINVFRNFVKFAQQFVKLTGIAVLYYSADKELSVKCVVVKFHQFIRHSRCSTFSRSLDSNLSIVESNNEVNKPGPQTPVSKKYPKDPPYNPKSLRDSFARAVSVPNDLLVKNSSERQSLR